MIEHEGTANDIRCRSATGQCGSVRHILVLAVLMVWVGPIHGSIAELIGTADVLSQVPLQDDGVAIRIPVKLFDKTCYFGVDTGSTCSMLDISYREKLRKPFAEGRLQTPISSQGKVSVYQAPVFSVGNIPARLKQVGSVDLKNFELATGERWDGILGLDFLSRHVVSLNFDKGLFTIYSHVPHDVKATALAVPFTWVDNIGVVISGFVEDVPVSLLIDTGNSRSLALGQTEWSKLSAARQDIRTRTVMIGTINSDFTQTQVAQVDRLEIQSQRYTDLLASLTPSPTGPSSIGLSFLRRHIVIFDFPQKVLYLVPGAHFSEKDAADMSGLHILRQDGRTYVRSIDPGSPASLAGVEPGDILLSVRGKEVALMRLRDVRDAFEAADGEKVPVWLRRGEKEASVQLTLKDLFVPYNGSISTKE